MLKGTALKFRTICGDMLGAIVASVVTLPQALAFGVATGFGATSGIVGAIVLSLVSGFVSVGVPIVSGITAPTTIVISSIMLSSGSNISSVLAIIFLAGILQIILGFTKLPRIVEYVPYPVISGFMNGIGFIIIIMQLNPLIGHAVKSNTITSLQALVENIHNINYSSLILGLVTLLLTFVIPKRISKYVPSQVIGLVVCTFISIKYGLNVERIGAISLESISFKFPHLVLSEILTNVHYAILLAIILSAESLMTGLVVDSIMKTKISTKRLLVGQGFGNIFSSMFGGVSGSCALMRTVAAINTGATTNLCTFMTPVIIGVLAFQFAHYIELIPMSVLAGILIKVGYDIIDTKLLKVLKHAPKDDLYVLTLVFMLTLFYNLIIAVGAGITFASLLYAKRIADNTKVVHRDESGKRVNVKERKLEKLSRHKIRIVHVDGAIFFGSATQIISHFDEIWGTKCIILDCSRDKYFDVSAIFAFEDIITRLQSQDIKLLLVLSNEEIKTQLEKFGILSQIGTDNLFYTLHDAITKSKELIK
jgi:SulP family sulfate permease